MLRDIDDRERRVPVCSDCPETVRALTAQGLPVIYLEREGAGPCYEAAWVWQCTSEAPWPDEDFQERVWRRAMHLPWLICSTDRLLIRESVPEDLEAFLRFYDEESGNPDVGRWSDNPEEQLQNYIDGQYRLFGYGLWTIVLRETGEVIGRAGLEQANRTAADCLEISWLIGRNYRRRGYALEAAQAILRYAKREFGCDCVAARTSAQNKASLSLIQKLRDAGLSEGDHRAGHSDQNCEAGGEYV